MTDWTGTYVDIEGNEHSVIVETTEFGDMPEAGALIMAAIPEGGTFVTLQRCDVAAQESARASAAMKLVDLGLTPEEAAAVAGGPVAQTSAAGVDSAP